jgi:tryptophan-rich sensory protein
VETLSTTNTTFSLQHGATLYTIQLGLNLIWMPLFFGLQRPIEATADIVALVGVTGYLTSVWVASTVSQAGLFGMAWICHVLEREF